MIFLNDDIRRAIKTSRVFSYEIAAQLGISEFTFSRWLRRELTEAQRNRIIAAIKQIQERDAND